MEKITRQMEIPVKYECDVVVVGGGPAGFCAAVAAARNGAKTVLVEKNGCCGGMATAGLVGPFMTSYNKSGDKMIIRGMFEEVIDRLVAQDGAIHPEYCRAGDQITGYHFRGHDHCGAFDSEVLKRVIDEMLTEAKVKVLYHTNFVEPLVEDDCMKGVIIFSKSGMAAIKAKIVIDCSGDADVAYRAGVPCDLGDPERGNAMQPTTMFFRISNVDWEKVEEAFQKSKLENRVKPNGKPYGLFGWIIEEAKAKGDFDVERETVGLYRSVKKDEWCVNISRILDINATDAEDLSKAEVIGRQQVLQIFNFLRNYIPGCENAKLMSSASHIGIRESRHIKGEATLNADNVLNGDIPEDVILLASNSIDVHASGGSSATKYVCVENGEWYGVSYKSLVPVKIDQLLVAGRSLSATSEGAGAVRVMPPCMEMGHAAGVAAALSLKQGCLVRDVDVKAVQEQMVKEGSFLG